MKFLAKLVFPVFFLVCVRASSLLKRLNFDLLNEVLKYVVDADDSVMCLNRNMLARYLQVRKLRFYRGYMFEMCEISDSKVED